MSFVISFEEIIGGKKVGDIYVKGLEGIDYYIEDENLLIFKGDIFPYNIPPKELFHNIVREGIGVVEQMKGEFFIVYYDINSRKVYFANDKLGRESLFYFYDSRNLILSDDFWEIIDIIEPKESDIDVQSIKELLVLSEILYGKTIIKNSLVFPSASIGEFSLQEKLLDIRQYWDFEYSPRSDLSIDETVERLDHLLDDAMRQIKEKHGPNTTYGLGLSGGLDSRLVAYYAVKNGMNLKTYIIGEAKPHKLFLSWDHTCAQKLAKHYNLPLYRVEYNCESFEKKSFYDLRYSPMRGSTLFLGIQDHLPGFEVLLNGFEGGEGFGAALPDDVMEIDEKGLLIYMTKTFSRIYVAPPSSIGSKFRTILDICFGRFSNVKRRAKEYERHSIDGIIQSSEYAEIESNVLKFIRDNSGKSNISIIQKFLYFAYAYKDKYGSQASMHGQKKSYSIFLNPFVLEEALTWRPEFLINKRLQRYFYVKKFPELCKIKAQSPEVAIYYRSRRFQILRGILILIEYLVRGSNLTSGIWAMRKDYKEFSRKILLRENSFFTSIFNVEKVLKLTEQDEGIYENIVKFKQILDLVFDKAERDRFMRQQ